MPGRLDAHVKKLADAHRAHTDAVVEHTRAGVAAHQAAEVERSRTDAELLADLGVNEGGL